jgi:2'-5' RNA ligase
MAFHRVLGTALKKANLGQWAKPGYTPHVTLMYDDSLLDATPVPPVTWMAGEVVLVHSLLGETRHIHLARWPLSGPSLH